MEYRMRLDKAPFEKIKSGKKCVEMRLNDERRCVLCIGDIIVFADNSSTEVLRAEITELRAFRDFYELYSEYDKRDIGYDDGDTADPADMYMYYDKEKIEKYGALAIALKVI